MRLSDGEKLSLLMQCDIYDATVKGGEFDTKMIREAIYGGHYWAFDWKMSGLFHEHVDNDATVTEVVNTFDVWSFIEAAYARMDPADQQRIRDEAGHGHAPEFPGWDGNNEGEHIGIARMMIEHLGRWSEFAGRDLNSHCPSVDGYAKMVETFKPIRATLGRHEMTVDQVISVLNARRLYPL